MNIKAILFPFTHTRLELKKNDIVWQINAKIYIAKKTIKIVKEHDHRKIIDLKGQLLVLIKRSFVKPLYLHFPIIYVVIIYLRT